jgi:hypothetical protein
LIAATGDIPPPSSGYITVLLDTTAVKYGGGIQGTGPNNTTYFGETHLFDMDTHVWTEVTNASPPGRMFAEAVAISNTELIMYGGTRYTQVPITVDVFDEYWKFNLNTQTWTQIFFTGTVPTPRFEHAMVFDPIDQNIYIWGGEQSLTGTDFEILGDMYKCSILTFSCTLVNQIGDVPVPRVDFIIRNLNINHQTFVASGGFNFSPRGQKSGLFFFDVSDNSWERQDFNLYNPEEKGRYPTPRDYPLFDLVDDIIVVFGGDVDSADVGGSYYNLMSDTLTYNLKNKPGCGPIPQKHIWMFQDLEFHPPAMKRIKSVVYNDEVYSFGGLHGGNFIGPENDNSDVFKYTPCG